MTSYPGEGGSSGPRWTPGTPSSATVPAYNGTVKEHKIADTQYQDFLWSDELNRLLNNAQSGTKGAFPDPATLAYYNNLVYIRDHGPQTVAQKKSKELDWNDIGNLLLDLAGYGSAIASIVPIPTVRAGGIIAGGATRAIRYTAAGSYSRAAREIDRTSRTLSRISKSGARTR